MKVVLTLLLVTLVLGNSLIPGFGLDQSTRLAGLAHHYQQHRQEQPSLGFLDFLEMHYGPNAEHQKHPNHSHSNLPAAGHAVAAFTPVPIRLLVSIPVQVVMLAKTACFRYANLYSFLGVFSLINPPRHA
ncbi:hypothetical protein GCM10027578_21000 [Spirosoma luteolum]